MVQQGGWGSEAGGGAAAGSKRKITKNLAWAAGLAAVRARMRARRRVTCVAAQCGTNLAVCMSTGLFRCVGGKKGRGGGGFDCSDDLYLLCGKAKERQQQQQQQQQQEERERSGACASVCGGGKRGRRGGGQAVVWVGGGCDSRPVFPLAANLFKAQAIGSDVCVGRRGFALCSAGRRREGRAEAVTGRRAGCVQVVCVRRRRMRGRGVDGERGGGNAAREKVCCCVGESVCAVDRRGVSG